jgi:mannitol/fructose-specific phosphotransferase system IIA component (Ntr-type)
MRSAGLQDGLSAGSEEGFSPRLSVLLAPERVKIPLRAASKHDVLAELVDVLVASLNVAADREGILQAVLERETVLSTGIGGGVALPHAKYDGLKGLVMSAGASSEPVEFEALDGQPVRLFFLLVGPDSAAGAHVRALSRVSRIVQNQSVRRSLVAAADSEQFVRILGEAERAT